MKMSDDVLSVALILARLYHHTSSLEAAVHALTGRDCLRVPSDTEKFRRTCSLTLLAGDKKEAICATFATHESPGTRLRRGSSIAALENVLRSARNNITTGINTNQKLLNLCHFLVTKGFDLVCERSGTSCISCLMQNFSIFLPLENQCYMQLTGPPLHNVFPSPTIALRSRLIGRWRRKKKMSLVVEVPRSATIGPSQVEGEGNTDTEVNGERDGKGPVSPVLQVTEAAPMAEKEIVSCGSPDALNQNEQNSLELFASSPVSKSESEEGAAGVSTGELSSINPLNTAYLQSQSSESLNREVHYQSSVLDSSSVLFHSVEEVSTGNLSPIIALNTEHQSSESLNEKINSILDSYLVLFHSSGDNATTELNGIQPGCCSQEGRTLERENNAKDDLAIIDPNESSSDMDYGWPETSGTDYDSDFASNRTYFKRRRKELGKDPLRDVHKKKISRLSEWAERTRSRYLCRRLHELKRTRMARKRRMWRRNKKLRRASASATTIRCVARKSCHKFPVKRTAGRSGVCSDLILRGNLFYATNMMEKRPLKYLVHCSSSIITARKLCEVVFKGYTRPKGPVGKPKGLRTVKLSRTLKRAFPLFQRLLWNLRHKVQCKSLLDHYCPIPDGFLVECAEGISKEELNSECTNLVNAHQTHEQVFGFLKSVVLRTIPPALWGSATNRQVFLQHLKSFVNLRRWENTSVEIMTRGIKLSHCDWLKCPSSKCGGKPHAPQRLYFQKFISWVMNDLIVWLLKSFFYVTEHQKYRNHVFYYRKKVWSRVQAIAIRLHAGKLLSSISEDEVIHMFQQNKTLGISKLRFLPKSSGVRPIVNLGSKASYLHAGRNGGKRMLESVNRQLQDVFHILNYEKAKRPRLCGSTCFGYHHVYDMLKAFVVGQNKLQSTSKNFSGKPLLLAHFDLSHCYDSMIPEKLMEILLAKVLSQEVYLIRRHACVFIKSGKIRRSFHRTAATSEDCVPFYKFASDLSKKSRNCIFIDQVTCPIVRRQKVAELLRKHLFGNLVQISGEYFHQVQGIPQGSKLSSVLCGFYYADMEETCLPEINSNKSLLVRFVDDFLLITREEDVAREMVKRLGDGIGAYNCTINKEKGGANFKLAEDGKVLLDEDVSWIEWCGLLLDTKSMDVRVDYSRYYMTNIRDCMTVTLHTKPLQGLCFFMQRAVLIRCLPVLLDTELLSYKCVLINIYQAFLLAALKFLAYITALPQWGRRRSGHKTVRLERKLVLYFFSVALRCFGYFWQLASKKCSFERGKRSCFTVARPLCMWLGCHAFKTMLSHHEPRRLSLLVRLLSCKLDTISNTLGPDLLKQCFRAIRSSSNNIILTAKY